MKVKLLILVNEGYKLYGNGGVNDFSFFMDFIDECLINFIFLSFFGFY